MARSLTMWDIFILNWLFDKYWLRWAVLTAGYEEELTLCLSSRFHISTISMWMMVTQLFRGWSAKSRLDQRLRQYPRGKYIHQKLAPLRSIYPRLRPFLRTKTDKWNKSERQTTYSMEAWMVISRDALKATDQARGTGAIRGFALWELDWDERAVRESVINRSLVTIRLLTRPPYSGITANKWWCLRVIPSRVEVITRNELCRHIPGFLKKQGTAQLFVLCVCPGPGTILVLVISIFGPRDMRVSQVGFRKCDNNRNWLSYQSNI